MADFSGILSRDVSARRVSRVATLYVVDVGEAANAGDRLVRYGRYIDAMPGTGVSARVVASSYVDGDRLRSAERALEDWMRDAGHVVKHPTAALSQSDVVRVRDFMSVLTSRYGGSCDEVISQMEKKDAAYAAEIRHLKQRLRLREDEVRLKDYEISLKDREISLAEHEILLLRNDADRFVSPRV